MRGVHRRYWGQASECPGGWQIVTQDAGDDVIVERIPRRARLGALRAAPGLGIQSKLLIMLLSVTVLSSVVVGVIASVNGTDALRGSVYQRLTEVRESRAREITTYFKDTSDALVVYTRGRTAIEAVQDFSAGFAALQSSTLSPAQDSAVDAYYSDYFVPQLEKRTGSDSAASVFIPKSPAERYLQANYTAPFTDFTKAIANNDAGDGSAWSAANAKYQDYFREIVNRAGFDDALILNTTGDVVYSAYKGVDLGTNVETGPYRGTELATAYKGALSSNAVDYVGVTDFERYQPSLGVPTLWIVSPIGEGGTISGALALQVPLDKVNSIMTDGGKWKRDGLGKTGEVYLAGPDKLMRSTSRELAENPKQYVKDVVAAGTPPRVAERAVAIKGSVLIQPVATGSVTSALAGKTGISLSTGYLGKENLTAYAPLDITGLDWVIVARVDSSEAFAPITTFTRNLVLSTAGIILLVSLLSLLLAQVFVRPLKRLMDGVRRVAAGERDVRVEPTTRDEFADVGNAFNDMSNSLQVKADLLDEQQEENERLLLTLMPEAVAKRYRRGDENIAEDHQDVSVIFADIVGFDRYTRGLKSEEALRALNEIVRSFDQAAEKLGVEKVRTTKESYLASCGLIVPRVDHARRIVDFAVELRAILERFNSQNGSDLALRAGIDTGTVTSGLVGPSSVAYDMWGDAVNLAFRIQGSERGAGIFVTQNVVDKLPQSSAFQESGTIDLPDGQQRVWRLDQETTSV
ncbi:MAG: adenylate/guanylate cyclase protein [Microbacteriaceae bacterium]|nr:adenylate/guanylate cyclase protein [Microbacteriaceae bacterium]